MNDGLNNTESARDAQFETVLDRELGRVLAGSASVEECCGAHPGFADELGPLLQLALSGRSALKLDDGPASGVASQEREKLMAHRHSIQVSNESGSWLRIRPLALASGLFLLLFAGTALAAGTADPDSILYPIKQGIESAQTTLAIQELDRARAEAEHANNRLDELQKMIDEGKGEYTGSLLANYDAHINNATVHTANAAAEGKDITEVDGYIRSVRDRHDVMLETLGLGEENGVQGGANQADTDGIDDSAAPHPEGSSAIPSADDDVSSDNQDHPGSNNHQGGSDGDDPGDDQQDDDGNNHGNNGDGNQSPEDNDDDGNHNGESLHDEPSRPDGLGDASDHNGPTAASRSNGR